MKNSRLTWFLLTRIAFVVLSIFFAGYVIAQTEHEAENLLRLSEKYRAEYEASYSEALRIADSLGLFVRIETEDGRIYQLVGIGEDGLLIYYGPDNAEGAALVNAGNVHPGGSANLALTGAGQTLGIWEGGIPLISHDEFTDQGGSRITIKDGATTVTDHATHVAGTMIAHGMVDIAKGISYAAHLDAYDHSNAESEMAAAAAGGLKVSNHSYGPITGWRYGDYSGISGWHWWGIVDISETEDYRFGFYNNQSRQWDEIAYNAPHHLIVKSAGNDRGRGPAQMGTEHFVRINNVWVTSTAIRDYDGGTDGYDCLPPRSTSKNNMVVGGVRANKDMYTFGYSGSSWGPTDDGRIKPDIVAKSVYVYSSISSDNDAYAYYTGTSMSAPMVSGAIGLISEHQENLNPGELLLSSTVKGLLLHSADDMIGGAPGPDYRYGWGLMDVEKAIAIMSNNDLTNNVHIQELTLNNGEEINIPVRARGHEPLRATIVWTDPPGTVPPISLNPTDLILVNDLDMRIVNAKSTYMPYILDPGNPAIAATTGDNFRDNVEMVHIENPGYDELFEITVSHKGSLSDGNQVFSLIITGNMELSGVADVQTFSAETIGDDQVSLNWTKNNENNDVMLVWSQDGIFGYPDDNVVYTVGDTIPGGGTVLYRGSDTGFDHTNLQPFTTYYYKAYSYDASSNYATGLPGQATAGVGEAKISVSPISIQQTVAYGESSHTLLNISNPGGSEVLTWYAGLWPANPEKTRVFACQKNRDEKSNNAPMDNDPATNRAHVPTMFNDENFQLLDYFPVMGGGGVYGTATDGSYIYSTQWNGDAFFKYEMDGSYIGMFYIDGVGGIRDLTYDGTYFYGSPNSNTIYQMDFTNNLLVGTIPAPSIVRGIAYDADIDGFWVTNGWVGPLTLINRSGTILQSLNTNVVSMSGLEWENVSGETPFLWAYTHPSGTSGQILTQIDLLSGQAIQSFDLATTGIPGPTNFSGGLFITNQVIPGRWTFLGLSQNDVVWLGNLAQDASWMFFIDPSSGVVLPDQNVDVDIHFDAGGLGLGTYHANIIIDHNAQTSFYESIVIPLEMEVVAGDGFYTLNLIASPEHGGDVYGGGLYMAGEEVNISAQPNEGWVFVAWTGDTNYVDDVNSEQTTVAMPDSDVNLTANFAIKVYTIFAAPNNEAFGTVSGSGDYEHFEDVTLTATANIGYYFVEWTEDGEVVLDGDEPAGEVYTFMAEADRELLAHFTIKTYVITASAGEGGSIDPEGEIVVDHGASQLFTVTPSEGYQILDVLVDGDSVGAVDQYEFTDITENHTIEAVFKVKTYVITASAGEGGSIDPEGNIVVDHGGSQLFTVTPGDGYSIFNVIVDGNSVGVVEQYEFVNVVDNHTISAEFEIEDETGIRDIVDKVSVYPNPFDHTVMISNAAGLRKMVIKNVFGQTVIEKDLHGSDELIISAESFKPGVYIFTLTGSDNSVKVYKMIKGY